MHKQESNSLISYSEENRRAHYVDRLKKIIRSLLIEGLSMNEAAERAGFTKERLRDVLRIAQLELRIVALKHGEKDVPDYKADGMNGLRQHAEFWLAWLDKWN